MTDFFNRRVTVLGLGRFGGGIAASRWLVAQGAQVVVADQSSWDKLADSVEQLKGLPLEFRLGVEQHIEDFTQTDLIVASPAVAPNNPYLQAARAAGVPITTEICLFAERCPAQIIGVTGTKGKSTTSTLLHLMLNTNRKTWLGGNIGKSLLKDLPNIGADDLVVLELSSFMLDHLGNIGWSPHVAVVTMISVDHLDWHGSESHYVNAKQNIVRFQEPTDYVVLNGANPGARSFAEHTPAKAFFFGVETQPRFSLKLSGEHNQLNAQAAFAAASIFGVEWQAAQDAIADFAGLTHRLQLVHQRNGIQFINDSISTIPEAAVAALHSFPKGSVIQIVGGSGKKELPIEQLCEELTQRAKAVLCIGQTGPQIASLLPPAMVHDCGTLDIALDRANFLAIAGDIVLLSPGHPSYDQFTNFESRGESFVELVRRAPQ